MGTPRPQYITDKNGKKTAVVLSLRRYRQMIEDLHDLAMVAERRREKPVPLQDLKRRLERDGVL
jgi:PHD/YefM family antitoxin component YafN of YafNO toxin-antitoxin module